MAGQLSEGWEVIARDIIIVLAIAGVLFYVIKSPKKGDEIPLTPPESLYAPHGATQTVK